MGANVVGTIDKSPVSAYCSLKRVACLARFHTGTSSNDKRTSLGGSVAQRFFCQVLTFCPTQLGHFRGVLNLSLGSDILVVPIRVIGEASTVGTKQPRYGCPGSRQKPINCNCNIVVNPRLRQLRSYLRVVSLLLWSLIVLARGISRSGREWK